MLFVNSTGPFSSLAATFLLFSLTAFCENKQNEFNYDESKVPSYELPPLLQTADGEAISDPVAWRTRREELLKLLHREGYGEVPGRPENMMFDVHERETPALDGKAVRTQVRVRFFGPDDPTFMNLLIYLPAKRSAKVPVILMMNFYGNQSINADPEILLGHGAIPWNKHGIAKNRPTEANRGRRSVRWPLELALARGYGVAAIHCGEIDPDFKDRWQDGVHPNYYRDGQSRPEPHEWGTISAWAWGFSRAMDYLETDDSVDGSRVIVAGHSRLGKTALLAGARDERFAAVISNNSGCGGAALSRRQFGETVARINRKFPHWFCTNFHKYGDDVGALPFDQHTLIACIAPRPVLVTSAEGDRWADPRGEFLAAKAASPVYQLYGYPGLANHSFPKPAPDQLYNERVAYHYRTGKHDVTPDDWRAYMAFADKQLATEKE